MSGVRITRATGKINVNIANCPGVLVAEKNVWVGKPYDFLVEGPTSFAPGSFNTYNMKEWGTPVNPAYPLFRTGSFRYWVYVVTRLAGDECWMGLQLLLR